MDIVLLDIYLDKESGFDICRELRAKYQNSPLQIIFISGHVDEKSERYFDAGGDDFVSKPFTSLEIKSRIRGAAIRFETQKAMLAEREYFRQAVKNEEALTSRILDQNLFLKKAYRNMENLHENLRKRKKELEEIARYDMLSGLLNRMSLISVLDMEIERSNRYQSPLSCILLDIDHFKHINDNNGHLCGDEVIRKIGELMKGYQRKYDHAGRYGGEEFVIVLPNTNLEQAENIAERFRGMLEDSPVVFEGKELTVTASFGISQYRKDETRSNWLERADQAMYTAKQRGRNQVFSVS